MTKLAETTNLMPSQKRPPQWHRPILRPGRAARRDGNPCIVHVVRFRRWLQANRPTKVRGIDAFGAVEVVLAACVERGATLRPSEQDVLAVLRRLRDRYPPFIARTILLKFVCCLRELPSEHCAMLLAVPRRRASGKTLIGGLEVRALPSAFDVDMR